MKLRTTLNILLALTVAITTSACGGCGGQNNDTTDMSQTDAPDMSSETPDMPGECTPGSAGCQCAADDKCDEGATCSNSMCVAVATSGLSFSSTDARSCELLIVEGEAKVLGATFAEGLKGAWRKRAPNVALVVTQTQDEALPEGAAQLQVDGELAGVKIESVSCFDHLGKPVDGVTATLD